MSLEQVVQDLPQDLDERLRKIENTISLLCDKVGMAHEAPLPPGKRRRPDPEVTAPCGSRGSENLAEELHVALHALSQRQGGETASDKVQDLQEQLVFLSECTNVAMQTLFAPQIEEAVVRQDLEMIRTKFREVPAWGLISDGVQTWKGLEDYWKTIAETKKYCSKMQKAVLDLQKNREYWNPFLVGLYNSNGKTNKRQRRRIEIDDGGNIIKVHQQPPPPQQMKMLALMPPWQTTLPRRELRSAGFFPTLDSSVRTYL